MTEVRLGCLPVSMTSVAKNVYPISASSDYLDTTNDDAVDSTEGNQGNAFYFTTPWHKLQLVTKQYCYIVSSIPSPLVFLKARWMTSMHTTISLGQAGMALFGKNHRTLIGCPILWDSFLCLRRAVALFGWMRWLTTKRLICDTTTIRYKRGSL